MNPITKAKNEVDTEKREIVTHEENCSVNCSRVSFVKENSFSKLSSTVTKLNSTFEIKQIWLYNEWASECQFSKFIRPNFPFRSDLDPKNQSPNIELIQSTFHNVRGKWDLWQSPREEARWKKIEVQDLKLDWVMKNVEVLYPSKEHFEVAELKGIVLWDDKKPNNNKKYKLYEGNHRISAWLSAQTPESLPAILFIGKPAKLF
ncbi:MAG: hypothetical protein H0U27_01240 [Nitrosopumilus sp.]|nr:hypothetical protein [Nitrosopumilus sp.]